MWEDGYVWLCPVINHKMFYICEIYFPLPDQMQPISKVTEIYCFANALASWSVKLIAMKEVQNRFCGTFVFLTKDYLCVRKHVFDYP